MRTTLRIHPGLAIQLRDGKASYIPAPQQLESVEDSVAEWIELYPESPDLPFVAAWLQVFEQQSEHEANEARSLSQPERSRIERYYIRAFEILAKRFAPIGNILLGPTLPFVVAWLDQFKEQTECSTSDGEAQLQPEWSKLEGFCQRVVVLVKTLRLVYESDDEAIRNARPVIRFVARRILGVAGVVAPSKNRSKMPSDR